MAARLLCGAGTAWAWTRSSCVLTAASALLVVGPLAAMAVSLVRAHEVKVRAKFQGASVGFPGAFLVLAPIQWRKTRQYFVARAEAYGDAKGLRRLIQHKLRRRVGNHNQ